MHHAARGRFDIAWPILGPALVIAVLSLFLIFRRERLRREQGLPPDVPKPLFLLYRLLALALLGLVAYSVLMSASSALQHGAI